MRRHDIRPCIEQHEIARAISVLGFAGQKANLPDGRGLLIAEVCAQRNFAFEGAARLSQAIEVCIRRRANGRQHRTWNVKEPEQFIIPIKSLEIEEHCAAGIRHIRDVRATLYAAAQVPDKPRVDVAEDRLTSTSGSPRAVDTLEDPLNLPAGKISRGRQSRFPANDFAGAGLFQLPHDAVGARVLPDNGVVERFTGFGIPDHGGFALVGDADRRKVLRGEIAMGKRGLDCLACALVNVHRIMFHPPGLRQNLRVLQLMTRHLSPGVIENHKTRARRALVNCANKSSHD